MPRYNPILEQLRTYPQQALEERKAAVLNSGKTLYDFGVGDPIEPTEQFIRDALCRAVLPHCGYPKVQGSPAFRQAVANYLDRRFQIMVDPERHILPTSGAKEAVFHAPLLVIDIQADDNLVVFPDPGYPAYCRGALFAGGEPYPVSLTGDYIFRPWELSKNILEKTRLLWLNTPHNPSGAVMRLSDLQQVYDLCQRYDILCVSDECYADIYDRDPPHSILECGLSNVIALHSLSKRSGMTGYRAGFMAGDPAIIAKYKKLRANPGLVPQSFVNAAAIEAWNDDTHVAQRREIFRQKKRPFLEFFDAQGWDTIGRDATLYLWVKAPQGKTGADWAMELLEAGLVVSPGAMFAMGDSATDYIRLAMVPSLEDCQAGLEVWKGLIL